MIGTLVSIPYILPMTPPRPSSTESRRVLTLRPRGSNLAVSQTLPQQLCRIRHSMDLGLSTSTSMLGRQKPYSNIKTCSWLIPPSSNRCTSLRHINHSPCHTHHCPRHLPPLPPPLHHRHLLHHLPHSPPPPLLSHQPLPIHRQPTPSPHHTRQQSLTRQPTVPPDPTHRLESGAQCSRHGSSSSPSVLPAPSRSRRICVEIAERRSLHGTHSHQEYSRKRTDVYAPEEHEREEPFHRRHGTISSWTSWPTRPLEEGPGYSVHATIGRQHRHPSSIDTTTPSQGTTVAPDPSASGSAGKTDRKASNSWHTPHTREATTSPLQDYQSRRTFRTIPHTATPHTTIPRLDTVPITGPQSINTSTCGASRATIPSCPESHNQIRTQETPGILSANTTLTIPSPILQAIPACRPTSSHPRAVSQPLSIHPPWNHRWSQLRSRINAIATSVPATPGTGYRYPTHQTLESRRTPHSLQCHKNPKVDCTTQQPRTHRACPRDHLHSCQDPQARTAQLGRDSSAIWLTHGRRHFDDLQDTLPVLRSGQSLGSLTSPPTLHYTTPNIPTPTTSPRHSHHSQMPGTPHTPPPSYRQTPSYLHPWPSPSYLHLSLRQHISTHGSNSFCNITLHLILTPSLARNRHRQSTSNFHFIITHTEHTTKLVTITSAVQTLVYTSVNSTAKQNSNNSETARHHTWN